MRIYIAEKPDAGKAIAANLPGASKSSPGYIQVGNVVVTWCIGHLLQLKDAKDYDPKYATWNMEQLPIYPEKMEIRPSNEGKDAYKNKQLSVLKSLLSNASEVVHAGDDDREGHLLVMQVLEHFNYRGKVLRMRFSALNPPSIKEALRNIEDNRKFDKLLESGKARSEADWLVGINLTRAFTVAFKNAGSERTITIGRVQTPILAMVVERDLLIEGFVPKTYYEPKVLVEKSAKQFVMSWLPPSKHGFDHEGHLIDLEVAKNAVVPRSVPELIVKSVDVSAGQENPPALFRLATMQAACSTRFGLSASKTLGVIQSLYEKHKILSYPRTKSSYLETSFHGEAPGLFSGITHIANENVLPFIAGADFSIKSSAFNDKEASPHHAIIPILPPEEFSRSALSEIEASVYDMVVERYLCHFYPAHIYESTHVIAVDPYGREYQVTGRVTVKPGWRAIGADRDSDEDNEESEGTSDGLPPIVVGDALRIVKAGIEQKKTRPPKYYSSGSLMLDLENVHRVIERRARLHGEAAIQKLKPIIAKLKSVSGLGTDATRGSLVDGLIAHEFLQEKKGRITSTDLGRELIKNVPEQITSPVMTALFEQALDGIHEGSISKAAFIAQQRKWIDGAIAYARTKPMQVTPYKRQPQKSKGRAEPPPPGAEKCPKCGNGSMIERKGPKGPFLGCSAYPACKHTAQVAGGGDSRPSPKPAASSEKCQKCGNGSMIERKGPKGPFLGCSAYPACKHYQKPTT